MFVVHQKNKSLLQVVNKETQFLLFVLTDFRSCFRVTVANFEQVFVCWIRYFKDSNNNNCYSLPFPANKCMLKVSNRNLRNINQR